MAPIKLVVKGDKKKKKEASPEVSPGPHGIVGAARLEQLLQGRVQVTGKAGSPGGGAVAIEGARARSL